jgi:hypothetical protein
MARPVPKRLRRRIELYKRTMIDDLLTSDGIRMDRKVTNDVIALRDRVKKGAIKRLTWRCYAV